MQFRRRESGAYQAAPSQHGRAGGSWSWPLSPSLRQLQNFASSTQGLRPASQIGLREGRRNHTSPAVGTRSSWMHSSRSSTRHRTPSWSAGRHRSARDIRTVSPYSSLSFATCRCTHQSLRKHHQPFARTCRFHDSRTHAQFHRPVCHRAAVPASRFSKCVWTLCIASCHSVHRTAVECGSTVEGMQLALLMPPR
jgi:hypothetical protein